MKPFSLSRKDLPDSVTVGGREYVVNTDFRAVLRILRMLADPEILDADRPALLKRMFYPNAAPADPFEGFRTFVRMGEEERAAASGESDFDYEQDAQEICSAFMQLYGIDLTEANMHWWKFRALLTGAFAGENALSNKVRIRHLHDTKAQRKAASEEAYRNARIRTAMSRSEANLERMIRERLQAGLPVDDLMRGEQDA